MSHQTVLAEPTHDSPEARLFRRQFPGWGFCGRCGYPWNQVKTHVTEYLEVTETHHGAGCFPLCEGCWTELGHPEARIEYYAALILAWGEDLTSETALLIQKAVANEPVTR